jgi:hypothetical protein
MVIYILAFLLYILINVEETVAEHLCTGLHVVLLLDNVASSSSQKKAGSVGTGRETLRLRSKGSATVQKVWFCYQ